MSTASATAPTSAAVDLVNVQVNGQWVQFPKGLRMIEALRCVQVEVPHYCYHPKLSSPGNCRMCLVETGMPARPAPGQTEVEKDEHGFAKIKTHYLVIGAHIEAIAVYAQHLHIQHVDPMGMLAVAAHGVVMVSIHMRYHIRFLCDKRVGED